MYTYKAKIVRVVDGDTFDADVDCGFLIFVKHRFRLMDADTPETWRPKSDAEATHGAAATARVVELMENKEVTLHTSKLGIYGRYSASVTLPDGSDLAETLTNEGLLKLESYPADQ